jgi:hypothetical protein
MSTDGHVDVSRLLGAFIGFTFAAYSCAHRAADFANVGVGNNVSVVPIAKATIDSCMISLLARSALS